MNALWIIPFVLVQDPTPPPAAVQAPAPDPRELFSDWAKHLQRAPVVHLVAEGVLVAADKQRPEVSVRWTFATEIWMAKGGKVNARTSWAGPKPEHGEPEKFTSIAYANGQRSWQGFEGPQPLQATDLSAPRFVPYPLPEIFGLFDGKPEAQPPASKISTDCDWGEPVHTMPTVLVVDPEKPGEEPAFWYGFTDHELAGWCGMSPERLGGDVVRGKVKKLEWLERLPEKDPPRFEPKLD